MIINMIGGTERHLPRQHGLRCWAHRELIVRKWRRSFWLNTVAFFSSRVEKIAEEGNSVQPKVSPPFPINSLRARRHEPCCVGKCHSAPPIIFINTIKIGGVQNLNLIGPLVSKLQIFKLILICKFQNVPCTLGFEVIHSEFFCISFRACIIILSLNFTINKLFWP